MGYFLIATMSASLLSGTPAQAAPADEPSPPLKREKSVPGRNATFTPPAADPVDAAARRTAKAAVTWPSAGTTTVDLAAGTDQASRARVGDLPVSVAAPTDPANRRAAARSAAGAVSRVRVEVLDRAAAEQAKRPDALLLRVGRADAGSVGAPVSMQVDYAGFRDVFGGDWAARLRLVALPECALSTPEAAGCQGTPLATGNDVAAGRLTADVSAAAGAVGTLVAVQAGPSGTSGSFAETSLSESATWEAGGSTGDFNWEYPLRVPPAPGELEPELSLDYSSASVDGRTTATNTQPSWVGEGFDLWPGFIERRYKPCAEDMAEGNNSTRTGDLCWATDNATVSLPGASGELIKDGTSGQWRLRNDTGAKIQRRTGAANGARDGEYWEVTTADGTLYVFGKHRLQGWASDAHAVTNSTWTVPVFGNHPNEPCRESSFDGSWCQQAWRWNLDYVVDRYGDTMSYFYTKETNRYARNISASKVSSYDRGGVLKEIQYGQRDGAVYTSRPIGKVLFTAQDRCVPGTECTKSNKSHWPDTPWDQECTGSSCTDKWTPTFWTGKRLAKITTQVWDAAAGKHVDVDSWTLRHAYPSPGDGTRAGLWLDGVTHAGHVGLPAGQSLAMPEVTFTGIQKPNRVDGIEGIPALNWWRIAAIHSESGGEMAVQYSDQECVAGSTPVPDANTKRCQPVRWTPENQSERQDWFNKYVVTKVVEYDRTTGLRPVVTSYEYLDGAAWRYAEADGIVRDKYRSWSQWRGYGRVITRTGDGADGPVTKSETRYLRGMHGDKKSAGGTKSVSVAATDIGNVVDEEPHAGFALETIVYLGNTNTVLSRSVQRPWLSAATATATHSWGTNRAYVQGTSLTLGREYFPDGRVRKTKSENTFSTVNGRPGVLSATNDLGDEATAADDKCMRYQYADSSTHHLHNVTTRITTYGVNCGVASPAPADVLTDVRNYYDGSDTFGAVRQGNLTRTEKLVGFSGTTPQFQTTNRAVYDLHGRVKESSETSGEKTKTDFTPAEGGPVTQVKTTNALGHEITTEMVPAWGVARATTDPNGAKAETEYDALGRVARVWQPGRKRGVDSPDVEHSYQVRKDGANAVVTRTLKHDGGYLTSYELFDGLMRERQTQAPAPGGGRVITDVIYDSRGEVAKEYGPYHNDGAAGFDVYQPTNEAMLPAVTKTLADGAGRVTDEIFLVQGVEQWRTHTDHAGDRVHVTVPNGGTSTTTVTDARGQTTELWQYHGKTPTPTVAGSYDVTKYTYTKRGEPATVTDSANNVWRYHYNVRGQQERSEDPDRGATSYTYDDATDELRSVTDARGKSVFYEYDTIGRPTVVREGSATGPKRVEWVYDTLAKGHPTSSTRWTGGHPYTTAVTDYDDAYRPLGTRVTIPAAQGNLAGSYEFRQTYHGDGSLATATLPAAGGLPAETLTYGYDTAFSLPSTLKSNLGNYVAASTYTPFSEPWQTTLSTDPKAESKWLKTTYEYWTGSRRLGRVQVDRDGSPQMLANTNYSWDPAGNLTKIKTDATGLASDTQCFGYDHLQRLTTAWTPTSGNCTLAPSAAQLAGPAPYYQSWTFDKTGNRKTQTTHSTGTPTVATSSYPTAGSARPHALTSVTTTGPSGNRLDQFTYDAAGNTLTRNLAGVTQTLDWDAEGLLTSVTEGGKTTSFVYDADGNRLLRTDPSGTTLYLGSDEVHRDATGALSCTRYYTHQDAGIAVRESGSGNGTLTWLSADHHGTNTLAVRADDLSVQRRYSDPYGEPRGPSPVSWPGEEGFVGGTMDASIGLTHLGARLYDSTRGRFISVDPLIDFSDPQQMNGYSYATNTPTSASDPDGLRDWNDAGNYDRRTHDKGKGKTKSQPPPRPKKCGTWDVVCKGKNAGNSIRRGASAAGRWVAEHKTIIITVTVSVAAGVGCGIVTAGAAAVACAVGAGALVGAAEYHFTTPASKRSVGGYFGAAAVGGGSGLLGAGIGKLAGQAIKAGAKALGNGGRAAAQAAGRAAGGEAKAAASAAGGGAKAASKGGASGCKNSFAAGTPVLMADGSHKPIEEVEVGDEVVATDPDQDVTEAETVTATIIGSGQKTLVDITVAGAAAAAEGDVLTATHNHPFWVDQRGAWIDAQALQPGDTLLRPDGSRVTVLAVVAYGALATVHNLTVDDVHTYYVRAGADDLLVHNCGGKSSGGDGGGYVGKHRAPDNDVASHRPREVNADNSIWDQSTAYIPENGVKSHRRSTSQHRVMAWFESRELVSNLKTSGGAMDMADAVGRASAFGSPIRGAIGRGVGFLLGGGFFKKAYQPKHLRKK